MDKGKKFIGNHEENLANSDADCITEAMHVDNDVEGVELLSRNVAYGGTWVGPRK